MISAGTNVALELMIHFSLPATYYLLQVLAWNPALDRTTKTLQRLLCHPQLVLIVDDSPAAWSQVPGFGLGLG